MAFCEVHFQSQALGFQTTVNVILPQLKNKGEIGVENNAKPGKYKCLYLLHGLSDDQSIWMRRTSIERYAQAKGICVVMPFGEKSFYTDMKYGSKYYTYISEELPAIMREFFNISEMRSDNYIAGLSMGGYGALKIGLRNPDKFCCAAGLSSVADIKGCRELFKNNFINIFGEDDDIPPEEDLFELAKSVSTHKNRPRIYMGVGTEDFLYDGNVRLKGVFESLNYDITYRESKGNHSWEFWDEYIQYVLDWMLD